MKLYHITFSFLLLSNKYATTIQLISIWLTRQMKFRHLNINNFNIGTKQLRNDFDADCNSNNSIRRIRSSNRESLKREKQLRKKWRKKNANRIACKSCKNRVNVLVKFMKRIAKNVVHAFTHFAWVVVSRYHSLVSSFRVFLCTRLDKSSARARAIA